MFNKIKSQRSFELFVIFCLSIITYLVSSSYDFLESLIEFSESHEDYEIDEFIIVFIFLTFAFLIFMIRRWKEAVRSELSLKERNDELEIAFKEIKELKSIIPICASCKKMRDDDGYWQQIEVFIDKYTNSELSHGICPECAKDLYPDL